MVKRSCIDCASTVCDDKHEKNWPDFCLTTNLNEKLYEEALDLYLNDEEDKLITRASAEVECENYGTGTRIEEICEFAEKIGAKKIGIATCVGLIAEARAAARIIRHRGFEVIGVACKVGAIPKRQIGLPERLNSVGHNMCNPILQAKILNEEGTDLNVLVGLCVGHDSLFYKYSDALCTTLVTKDRVLGHNPAAALYQVNSYYKKLLK